MDYEEVKNITNEKFDNLDFKVGDMFQEMYSFWLFVIGFHNGNVITFEGHPRHPAGVEIKFTEPEKLKERFSYSSIKGYSIDYYKNDINYIHDWFESYEGVSASNKRRSKIVKLLIDFENIALPQITTSKWIIKMKN